MCLDHPTVQDLVGQIEDRRVITYGENPQADFCVKNIDLTGGQSRFSLEIRDRKTGQVTLVARSHDAHARPSQRAERHRRDCRRA